MPLFIAMNHFDVEPAHAAEFEARWRERDTYLREVPGFVRFALLRASEPGPQAATQSDGGAQRAEGERRSQRYVSHSTWESRAAFEAWTRSEAFRRAHGQARMPAGVLRGHPRLETFEAVLEQA